MAWALALVCAAADVVGLQVGWEGLVAVSKAVASPSSQIRVLKLCENSGLETSSGVEGSEVHPDAAGGAGSEVIAALTTAASLREIWLDKCNVSANFLRHMRWADRTPDKPRVPVLT